MSSWNPHRSHGGNNNMTVNSNLSHNANEYDSEEEGEIGAGSSGNELPSSSLPTNMMESTSSLNNLNTASSNNNLQLNVNASMTGALHSTGSFGMDQRPPPPPPPPPQQALNRRSSWGGTTHSGGRGGRGGVGGGRGPPPSHFGAGMHRSVSLGGRGMAGARDVINNNAGPANPRPTDPRFRNNPTRSLPPQVPPPPPPPSGPPTTETPSYSSLADEGPMMGGGAGSGGGGGSSMAAARRPSEELHFRKEPPGAVFRREPGFRGNDGPPFRTPHDEGGGNFGAGSNAASVGGEKTGFGTKGFNNSDPNFRNEPPPSSGPPNFDGNFRNGNEGSTNSLVDFRGGTGDFRSGGPGEPPDFRGGGGFRGRGGYFRGRGRGGRGRGDSASTLPLLPPEGSGGSYYGPVGDDRFGRSPVRGRFRGRGRPPMGRGGRGGPPESNVNPSMLPEDVRSGSGTFRGTSIPPLHKEHFGRSWSGNATSPNQGPRRTVDAENIIAPSSSLPNLHSTNQPPPPPPPPFHSIAPPAAPNQVSTETSQPTVPTASEPPPALDTSALAENEERAEKVIKALAELMQDNSLSRPGSQSSLLPNKQLLFSAMAKLDLRTKELQKQVDAKQAALETVTSACSKALEEEESMQARAATEQEQARQAARQELEDNHQENKKDLVKQGEAEFESAIAKASAELEKDIRQRKDDLEGRLNEDIQVQLTAAAASFEADEKQAQKDIQKVTQAVTKTEARLEVIEANLKEKRRTQRASCSTTSERKSMQDFVSNILAENQRRAAEAHSDLFDNSTINGKDIEFCFVSDLEERRDPKENRTLHEWSDLARQVQGLSTALYAEPSETPYFARNEEHHRLLEPLLKEYVRDSQNRLKTHFVELAEEYEYRRRLYKQQRKLHHASIPEKARKPASALIPRQTNMMILESGGSRAPQPTTAASVGATSTVVASNQTSNPYRRARRNNEVRSEYEQEQIIAELAAKEAMEKKIAFGGSALPRQIGSLERKLIPQFVNTFNSQKIDLEELEQDLAISNTWSDMEKCIFLDRFMQHPKDFRKIASFLRNKTTRDCVAYYYDSKKTVPYKFALKEFVMRRKRRGNYHIWDASIQAALASGAVVRAGPNEDKPLMFLLPESDETYVSHGLHPIKLEILDGMEIDEKAAADYIAEHENDEPDEECGTNKRKADTLMEVAPEIRKYLKVEMPTPSAAPPPTKDLGRAKESSKDLESGKVSTSTKNPASSKNKPPPPAFAVAETEETPPGEGSDRMTPLRTKPQKWTSAEKRIFVETLEKHGRKWEVLANAVGTKSIGQIKNFYYDYKKQTGRGARVKKISNRSERLKARDGEESIAKVARNEESSITETGGDGGTVIKEARIKESGDSAKTEEAANSENKISEPAVFPPSFASLLHQETISPLPTAPTLGQQSHSFPHGRGEIAAPTIPDGILDSKAHHHQQQPSLHGSVSEQSQAIPSLTEQQLREITLAQQIQALQQELAATRSSTRSGHDWVSQPATHQATSRMEPSLSGEAARLLHHHSQSQHQQILSNLMPWVGSGLLGTGSNNIAPSSATNTASNPMRNVSADHFSGGVGGLSDIDQHQLHALLNLQQQPPPQQQRHPPQQHSQQASSLHDLALSGLVNPSALRLLEQQQQQQNHHRHQQQHHQQSRTTADDPRLELLRQLLGGGDTGGGHGGSSHAGSFRDYLPR